ncbi:PBP1A family penicillin-binding protein [Heliobacterium chlorum]|uniref:Penicillin-binding protein 1A n=1 Tax=Heliobacterium chlorum TaxID=2698 RepID=A0ABR7T462_HELCL|nr:PBP1A family penicillin-binding protein [Heliobacterium chlorum]MBC9785555.1 PBP1A family penicillin-binding protein [Heliobacterium chlorum]
MPVPEKSADSTQTTTASSLKRPWWRQLFFAIGLIFLSIFLGLVAAAGYTTYWFITDVPQFNVDDFASPTTSFVYDMNGQLICELHGPQHRIPLPLSKISKKLQTAVLAAEDVRFYDHPGFDVRGIMRALKSNYDAGSIQEGASTITQQLIKNVYLGPEKTLNRKLKEIHLAYHLERQIGKDRVLELYLNRIYFGEGAYGVEAAARTYFGKSVNDLTVAECALLAGIPKNPSAFSPTASLDAAEERRNTVISQMATYGFITTEQAERARKEPIRLNPNPPEKDIHYPYPFFIDEVLREATRIHGISEDQLFGGGLRIYTTLDRRVQKLAEDAFTDPNLFPQSVDDRLVEGALAAVDPMTGYVKALVGGRTYEERRGFNRATMMQRSPGSAIKPLAVYAPALEQGWSPNAMLPDEQIDFQGYRPNNYDGVFRGQVTMRQAVAQSINIPAVWLLDRIGVRSAFDTLRIMGMPISEKDANLSLALGGLDKGVSPLDMARGYAALANGGTAVETRTIIQVYGPLDRPMAKAPKKTSLFQMATAKQMTSMLQDVVRYGTGREARLSRPVAGKTGTSELPPLPIFEGVKGNRDAWFVGYTPELVTAVWMGYDKTDRRHYLNRVYGGSYPARMFHLFMEGALAEMEVRPSELFTTDSAPVPAPSAGKSEAEESSSPPSTNSQTQESAPSPPQAETQPGNTEPSGSTNAIPSPPAEKMPTKPDALSPLERQTPLTPLSPPEKRE